MERFSTCELREKEVINLCDGARLGTPCDFEFDVCDGKITGEVMAKETSQNEVLKFATEFEKKQQVS